MSRYETLSLVASFLGVLVSAVVLVLLLWQLSLLRDQVRYSSEALEDARRVSEKENVRLARQATFDFLAGTNAKAQELALLLPPRGSPQAEVDRFLARAHNRGSDEFLALRNSLNLLENLLTGVNMKVFDREVIVRTSRTRILSTWLRYGGWITREREHTGQATLWKELEEFCASLQD